eukprot:scaffold108207_cov26-Prasinocladus_malaysianus.AAC.1
MTTVGYSYNAFSNEYGYPYVKVALLVRILVPVEGRRTKGPRTVVAPREAMPWYHYEYSYHGRVPLQNTSKANGPSGRHQRPLADACPVSLRLYCRPLTSVTHARTRTTQQASELTRKLWLVVSRHRDVPASKDTK